MSGKDLFDALGRISEKNAALTVKRSKKAKTRSIIFKTLKITAAAASVLLIIGFALFMWVFSEKMKDPPVVPAASDTEMQTKPEDTQPENQESYVQTLKKAIEEYLSQGYEKIIENIDGTPQITITAYKTPHEAGGQFYGGIYVYAASKIERHGVTGYVGEGDAQYGVYTDETKYLALAAKPGEAFTDDIKVEQVGDYLFLYGSGSMRVSVVIGERCYYGLKEAYKYKVIDDTDLYAASLMFGKSSAKIDCSAVRLNGKMTGINAERINGMCMIPFVPLMDAMFGVSEESAGRYTFEFKGREYYIDVRESKAGDAATGDEYLITALEETWEDEVDPLVGGRITYRNEELYVEKVVLEKFFELAGIDATVQDPSPYDDINILCSMTPTDTDPPQENETENIIKAIEEYLSQDRKKLTYTAIRDVYVEDKTVPGISEEAEDTFTGFEDPFGASGNFCGYYVTSAVKLVTKYKDGNTLTRYFAFVSDGKSSYLAVERSEYIGLHKFSYGSSQLLTVIIGGDYYYGLSAAFEAGVIEEPDLDAAGKCFGAGYSKSKLEEKYVIMDPGAPVNHKAICAHGYTMMPFTDIMRRICGGAEWISETECRFTLNGTVYTADLEAQTVRSEKNPDYDLFTPPFGVDYDEFEWIYAFDKELYIEAQVLFGTFFPFAGVDANFADSGTNSIRIYFSIRPDETTAPDETDIAFRSRKAIKAAEELYRAVQYGDTPGGLIDDTNRYDGINTFDSSELYAYFERYIDKNTVRPYIKVTNAVKIEDGKITLRPLAPRLSLYIDANSAHTVSQSGNKAVIAANVHIPDAMDGYDREMTFEVVDGDDGVIITGGTFAEKMLSPYAEAADSVCRALEAYLILREGQGIYDNAVYLSDRYFSLNDVPEEYRYLVTDTGKQPLLTLYAHAAEKPGLTTAVSPDIIAELCKITQVYDGALLHPENSVIKTEPAFEHGYYYMTEDGEAYLASIMTVYDVMIGMTVENVTSDRLTVSVDLTSTENGVKKTASYTFELQIGVSKGYDGYEANTYTLIGGTFVTELIYGK